MKKIFWLLLVILLALPLFSSARPAYSTPRGVEINPAEPVPVPYNPFFITGPAGRVTASGLIISIINIALWIVGLLAVLFLIVGGYRYITAHGNEEAAEAAKKTIQQAIIGIVIVILAFVIVRVIANALIYGAFGT